MDILFCITFCFSICRQNIVSRGRESTSGLAYYGGICRRMQRCAVVQDSGLDLGLTVAHELAHRYILYCFIHFSENTRTYLYHIAIIHIVVSV